MVSLTGRRLARFVLGQPRQSDLLDHSWGLALNGCTVEPAKQADDWNTREKLEHCNCNSGMVIDVLNKYASNMSVGSDYRFSKIRLEVPSSNVLNVL